MPPIPKRPLRFQIRTLLRKSFITPDDPWWMVVHRRGLRRERIGEDQLEARAIPYGVIKGYLTERIMYKSLVTEFHFEPEVDFLYQSSQEGGRLEMGGLVADFIFPTLRVVLNPTGPQHEQFRNMKKDDEQVAIFASLGYDVYFIPEAVVFDEYALSQLLRRIFGLLGSPGGGAGATTAEVVAGEEQRMNEIEVLHYQVVQFMIDLYAMFGR